MSNALDLNDARYIADSIVTRLNAFPHEDVHTSIMVVLLNAGDRFTHVRCVGPETWRGQKGDLHPTNGDLPRCPAGHVLVEQAADRKSLGWVDAL